MRLPKPLLIGIALASFAWLTTGTALRGQDYSASTDYTLSPGAAARADWERRAVRQPARTATPSASAAYSRTGSQRNWAPARTVGQTSPAPAAAPATDKLAPIPQTNTKSGPQPYMTADGDVQFENLPGEVIEGEPIGGMPGNGGCQSCPGGGDAWCGCSDDCDMPGGVCGLFPMCGGWLRRFEFFAGAHGFKGPLDAGLNGNFGFQEGFNFGTPLGGLLGGDGIREIGFQVGLQAVQSNFRGDQAQGALVEGARDQVFVTAGLFHRAVCAGLQWGVAFDYLHDSYHTQADFRQLRTEIGLVNARGGEIGFYGQFGLANKNVDDGFNQFQLEPIDLYALYLRKTFCEGGSARGRVGMTKNSDLVLGLDLHVPFSQNWGLENTALFIVPKEGTNTGGQARETWALGINLVWRPGRCRDECEDQFRPLMPVADNSWMVIDRIDLQAQP